MRKKIVFSIFLLIFVFCIGSVFANIQAVSGQSHPLLIETTSTSENMNGTLAQAPVLGNILIATVASRNMGYLSSISELGVTWTLVNHVTTSGPYTVYTEIWDGKVQSGASASLTIRFPNTISEILVRISEYSGLDNVST